MRVSGLTATGCRGTNGLLSRSLVSNRIEWHHSVFGDRSSEDDELRLHQRDEHRQPTDSSGGHTVADDRLSVALQQPGNTAAVSIQPGDRRPVLLLQDESVGEAWAEWNEHNFLMLIAI